MKDKYGMKYDGKSWILITKKQLIDDIYDDKKNYIEENLNDFIDSLSTSRINALRRWLNTDENDKKILDIKERIKLYLYNNKELPLKTRKENENYIAIK
jgi:hypothetical protein